MFVGCENCIADRLKRLHIDRSAGNGAGTYTALIFKGDSDIDCFIASELQYQSYDWVDETVKSRKILEHLRKTQQKVRVFDTDDWNEVISGRWKDVLLPIWKPEE